MCINYSLINSFFTIHTKHIIYTKESLHLDKMALRIMAYMIITMYSLKITFFFDPIAWQSDAVKGSCTYKWFFWKLRLLGGKLSCPKSICFTNKEMIYYELESPILLLQKSLRQELFSSFPFPRQHNNFLYINNFSLWVGSRINFPVAKWNLFASPVPQQMTNFHEKLLLWDEGILRNHVGSPQ